MRWRRLLSGFALLGLTIAVAVVGGLPDLGKSFDLVTGNFTAATESAVIVLLCWLVVVFLAIVGTMSLLAASRLPGQRARARSLAVVALGLTLLGMGIVRQAAGYRVCCGDQNTAHHAEQLVH